jgi:hypothetical protein
MATTVINAEQLHPEQRRIFAALLAELTAVRTAYAVLTAKLDADAGVTDTNYTTLCAIAAAQVTP